MTTTLVPALAAFFIGCSAGALGVLLALAYVALRVALSRRTTPALSGAQRDSATPSASPGAATVQESRGPVSTLDAHEWHLTRLEAANLVLRPLTAWHALGFWQ